MTKTTNRISIDDFVAYMPTHSYIFLPTREHWPASSVNAQLPKPIALLNDKGKPVLDRMGRPKTIPTSVWLDRNQPVHQMTWTPAEELLIMDKVVAEGGWVDKPGAVCLNLYRPPAVIKGGDARKAGRWLDHIRKIYPDDASHIIKWLAHRVQHPGDKLNHALVLLGKQGIGKDTIMEPVRNAIGQWNFTETSPTKMLGAFNGYLKSVILHIAEAHDLGETTRFAFYETTKTEIAAPPPTHRVNEKYLGTQYVVNVCGVVITSNHQSDAIYLPADDRRHYVAWSKFKKEDFTKAYWDAMYKWYDNGGNSHVAAYLMKLDLRHFNPKAPPPKTEAFWQIVNANRPAEEGELTDIIEKLGKPKALTIDQVTAKAGEQFATWLRDIKSRRAIPHRLETVGYTPVRSPDAESGLWRIDKVKFSYIDGTPRAVGTESERKMIYAQTSLSPKEQTEAATQLRNAATKKANETVAAAASNPKK